MTEDIFSGYCKNYYELLKWFRYHQEYQETEVFPSDDTHSCVEDYNANRYNHHVRNRRHKKKGRRRKSCESINNDQWNSACEYEYINDEEEEDESLEMVVTDEMAQFLMISAMHRKERDMMDTSATEITDDHSNPCSSIQKPGEKRLKEMRLLYGEGASTIHAMETAMQLSFQKNFDQKLPKLWPIVPLNLKFD